MSSVYPYRTVLKIFHEVYSLLWLSVALWHIKTKGDYGIKFSCGWLGKETTHATVLNFKLAFLE